MGLKCESCTRLASLRLRKLPGVSRVEVSLDGKVCLDASRTFAREDIEKALRGTGYRLAAMDAAS
ncbi:MAG: heavy-metal-associated domain-containing protein [Candidatus Geothermincolia bacterium]